MELVVSVALVCLTLIYLAQTLGPPQLSIYIAPKVGAVGAEPVETTDPIPPLPMEIQLFCAAESEPFAREVLIQRAHKLYRECKDWSRVLAGLQSLEETEE